mmetsp:Transcript_72572/g.173176  ORF Transcript_72572/g.173176 Transcript_72572/m.173176 type:complete len:327 (-) Transcript_72572:1042-2022(-)
MRGRETEDLAKYIELLQVCHVRFRRFQSQRDFVPRLLVCQLQLHVSHRGCAVHTHGGLLVLLLHLRHDCLEVLGGPRSRAPQSGDLGPQGLHFVRDAAQGSLATCHDLLQHRGGELSELDALLLQVVHLQVVRGPSRTNEADHPKEKLRGWHRLPAPITQVVVELQHLLRGDLQNLELSVSLPQRHLQRDPAFCDPVHLATMHAGNVLEALLQPRQAYQVNPHALGFVQQLSLCDGVGSHLVEEDDHGVGRQHGHKEQDNHKGVDLNLIGKLIRLPQNVRDSLPLQRVHGQIILAQHRGSIAGEKLALAGEKEKPNYGEKRPQNRN